jgi:hypothetical protein
VAGGSSLLPELTAEPRGRGLGRAARGEGELPAVEVLAGDEPPETDVLAG